MVVDLLVASVEGWQFELEFICSYLIRCELNEFEFEFEKIDLFNK